MSRDKSPKIDKNFLLAACQSVKNRSQDQLKEIDESLEGLKEMEKLMINSQPPLSYESAVSYEAGIEDFRNDFIAMKDYHRWLIRDMERLSKKVARE